MKKILRKIYCYFKYGAVPTFPKELAGREHWNLGNHLTGRCGCGRHIKK